MAIRAVTFDFWRTLFRDNEQAPRQRLRIEALCRATGVNAGAAEEALSITWVEFTRCHSTEQRTLGPRDAVRLVTKALNVPVSPDVAEDLAEVFATAILEYSPVPIEGALDAVLAAAARWPVAIISDSGVSPGASLRKLLDRHGFLRLFQTTVFSDEVGVSKPRAPMFEIAAKGLGVSACDLFHIGDLEKTDIRGARAVGALAGLFAGDNSDHVSATEADFVFQTWPDFVEVLPGIS